MTDRFIRELLALDPEKLSLSELMFFHEVAVRLKESLVGIVRPLKLPTECLCSFTRLWLPGSRYVDDPYCDE